MRVRMKIVISGTRDGAAWPQVGDEIDLPGDEADQLVRSGLAEPVKVEPQAAPKAAPAPPEPRGRIARRKG